MGEGRARDDAGDSIEADAPEQRAAGQPPPKAKRAQRSADQAQRGRRTSSEKLMGAERATTRPADFRERLDAVSAALSTIPGDLDVETRVALLELADAIDNLLRGVE